MKLRQGCDVGFTGSREGMSERQKRDFENTMKTLAPSVFRHGACVGADREAHDIVRGLFPASVCAIAVYPSTNARMTDQFCIDDADELFPPRPALLRDKDIVDAAEYMVATPKTDHEILRSGTWATIRMTERAKKPLIKLKR